jgi:hypothetical protein
VRLRKRWLWLGLFLLSAFVALIALISVRNVQRKQEYARWLGRSLGYDLPEGTTIDELMDQADIAPFNATWVVFALELTPSAARDLAPGVMERDGNQLLEDPFDFRCHGELVQAWRLGEKRRLVGKSWSGPRENLFSLVFHPDGGRALLCVTYEE